MFKLLSSTLLGLLAISFVSLPAFALENEGSEESETIGYDTIVDQLNRENAARAATIRAKTNTPASESALDSVWMHGGVGFANFIESIQFNDGTSTTLNQKGVQASLGIDLFSPNWMAEGTARSFAEDGDASIRSAVHEFELKVLYKDHLTSRFGYRAGLGMSGRYLTIKRIGVDDNTYTTPMSVATVGGDVFLNDRISLGLDLNARNSLIGETLDRNSFDMTIRADAHF